MSRWRQYLAVAIILNLLWVQVLPSPVWGQNTEATLRVLPPALEITAGQTVDIAVAVEDVTELYGFDIAVAYDPAIVEVMDLDPEEDGIQLALGVFLDPGFVIFNQADNSLGQLRLVMTQLSPSTPKSGDGNLVVIRFRGRQTGQTPLLLLTGELAQRDGTTFEPEWVDGELTVAAESPPQPIVFTPIPSQIAGTPLPTTTPELLATATPVVEATATATSAAATANPLATPTRESSPTAAVATATPVNPNSGVTATATAATGVGSSPAVVESTATSVPAGLLETAVATAGGTVVAATAMPTGEGATAVAAAATANATDEVRVIGSDSSADAGGGGDAASGGENGEANSWAVGTVLGGGLLTAIIALFFFLARKRTGGTQ